jgi:uncharacterized protein (UPF0261 family)
MKTIAVLGTLDSKGEEHAFVAGLIRERGHAALLIDVGSGGPPVVTPDISREEVAAAAGLDLAPLMAKRDRGECVVAMSKAAPVLLEKLVAAGKIDGVISLGGGGGTAIGTAAMRALPLGFPKLMVSTLASGNTAPYLGTKDIVMMPSIADVAGLNRLSRLIFSRAAGSICGMVEAKVEVDAAKPLVVASMFGNTTACITEAKRILEDAGYEVLVFAATGAGGRTMESLIESGMVSGVLDLTTTEWADELVGGVLNAGPERMDAAARGRGARGDRAGLPRHGEFRRGGLGAREVRRAEFLHPQPAGHADADHAGGVRGARPDPCGKSECLHGGVCGVDPAASDQRYQRGRPAFPRCGGG